MIPALHCGPVLLQSLFHIHRLAETHEAIATRPSVAPHANHHSFSQSKKKRKNEFVEERDTQSKSTHLFSNIRQTHTLAPPHTHRRRARTHTHASDKGDRRGSAKDSTCCAQISSIHSTQKKARPCAQARARTHTHKHTHTHTHTHTHGMRSSPSRSIAHRTPRPRA